MVVASQVNMVQLNERGSYRQPSGAVSTSICNQQLLYDQNVHLYDHRSKPFDLLYQDQHFSMRYQYQLHWHHQKQVWRSVHQNVSSVTYQPYPHQIVLILYCQIHDHRKQFSACL